MISVEKINRNNYNYFEKKIEKLMYGNKSCSLENLKTSCFASEMCSTKRNFTSITDFLLSGYAFAITIENSVCGCYGLQKNYMSQEFYHIVPEKNSFFIHSLCISNSLRGKGLGTFVLEELKKLNVPLYLTVLKTMIDEFKEFFDTKINNLVNFYSKTGFLNIDENDNLILFKY